MSRPASTPFPWSSIPAPESGAMQRGWIPGAGPDRPQEQPYIVFRGAHPGPATLVRADSGFAVTHGALRLADVLDGRRLHGALLVLPNSLSDAGASPAILELLHPAGTIIDLETSPVWKMSLSSVWWHAPEGHVDERSRDVAHSFNLPYTLATDFSRWPRERLLGADPSKSLLCRAVINEDGSGRDALAGRVMNGIVNALRVLGNLEGLPSPTETVDGRLIGIARSPAAGLWIPDVAPGQEVTQESRLGELRAMTGEALGTMFATHPGIVLACSHAVQVAERDPLVWVAAPDRFVT